jgi:HK97 gp10 family phage protein
MMKMTEKRLKYGDPKKAVKLALNPSSLNIGVAIASQAKLLAPVDHGQLRNSISVSTLNETKLLNDGGFSPKTSPMEYAEELDTQGLKANEAYVGSNTDHTIFMEYGTVKTPAQPFLRPSAELIVDRKSAGDIIAKYGKEAMDKEFQGRK